MQVREEFFTRPKKKMAKSHSKPRSPVPLHHTEARNVYEDNDTDNSDIEILKGGDSGGHRYREDSGRRLEKRRRFEYDSDIEHFKSPPPRRREGRRSPPAWFNEDIYRRRERRERPDDGPSSSKVKRERLLTPEGYHRDSRGHSGNRDLTNIAEVDSTLGTQGSLQDEKPRARKTGMDVLRVGRLP